MPEPSMVASKLRSTELFGHATTLKSASVSSDQVPLRLQFASLHIGPSSPKPNGQQFKLQSPLYGVSARRCVRWTDSVGSSCAGPSTQTNVPGSGSKAIYNARFVVINAQRESIQTFFCYSAVPSRLF